MRFYPRRQPWTIQRYSNTSWGNIPLLIWLRCSGLLRPTVSSPAVFPQQRLIVAEIDPNLEGSKTGAPVGPTSAMVDANPSPISFSDASSVNGSLYSACSEVSAHKVPNTSAPTVRHTRARSTGRKVLSKLPNSRSQTKPTYHAPLKKKATFECPFCAERCITVEISRKNDLKRHFTEFHANKAVWPCRARGCQMIFDWKSAYVAHLRTAHNGSGYPAEDVMVSTCPQVVFGCGFSNCKRVFEAVSDVDAGQKITDYFAHVAEHFEDGLTHKDWSFSTRFRNLMRQELVEDAWKQRKKTPQQGTSWQPLSSFTLRKMLECRHLPDIPLFVQWAATLSSMQYSIPGTPQPMLPSQFMIPIKQSCPLAQIDHRSDRSYLSMMPLPETQLSEGQGAPAPCYNDITTPSSPRPDQGHLPFSGNEDGLPAIGPWMDTMAPPLPTSAPIDPALSSSSMTVMSHPAYTEDATMTQGSSYEFWQDITFDSTFDAQLELSNIIQNIGESHKVETYHASPPSSSMSLGYPTSTASKGSDKDNKVPEIPTYKFQFNMH